jgi:CRISPR-associated protein Cpf1
MINLKYMELSQGEESMNLYYGELTNQYSVSKTLRNRLIPVGKTLDNIRLNHVLEKDQEKSDAYPMVKKMIDKYHLMIINEALDALSVG